MTTTRRRKAPTRSVAIRRVKPIAKRKERKTQKRKSRNKVMRGGAGDILLYYEPGVNPPKCFIIKENKPGRKDNLYLFFAADITLDQVKSYVCLAMGINKETSVFKPEFDLAPETDNNGSFKLLHNLFVRLNGMFSYTTIESGYLTRGDDVKHKHIVTSREHKITSQLTSASNINSWKEVVKKLKFQQYTEGFEYVELTSNVAENCYDNIRERLKSDAVAFCRKQIDKLMDKSDHNYIGKMKNEIMKTTNSLKEQIRINKLTDKSNADAQKLINFFKNNAEYSLDENITGLKSFYDRFKYRATINKKVVLSPECLKVLESYLESYLGLDKFKTIQEMVDEAYAGNSSEISSQP